MRKYKTEQEDFWAGDFGQEYIKRNNSPNLLANNLMLFSKIFTNLCPIESVIEFGANIGMNLRAIQQLLPKARLSAVEINSVASESLKQINNVQVYNQSILDFDTEEQFDFVFTKGVLIHIDPQSLQDVYEKLYSASKRYICIIEYYNPTPVEVKYRGHDGKMFKRDFAGELMQEYPSLKLLDYGFIYHKSYNFSDDDFNWFILQK